MANPSKPASAEDITNLRASTLHVFIANAGYDAVDDIRTDIRTGGGDNFTMVYFEKKLATKLDNLASYEPLEDTAAEKRRLRFRNGAGAIEAADAEQLQKILDKQEDILSDRMERDGISLRGLDTESHKGISSVAFGKLVEAEKLLIEREFYLSIDRDAFQQPAEFRADVEVSVKRALDQIAEKMAPLSGKNPEHKSTIERSDEPGLPPLPQDLPPKEQSSPAARDLDSLLDTLGWRLRHPLQLNKEVVPMLEEFVPTPPELMPPEEKKFDPSRRDPKGLRENIEQFNPEPSFKQPVEDEKPSAKPKVVSTGTNAPDFAALLVSADKIELSGNAGPRAVTSTLVGKGAGRGGSV